MGVAVLHTSLCLLALSFISFMTNYYSNLSLLVSELSLMEKEDKERGKREEGRKGGREKINVFHQNVVRINQNEVIWEIIRIGT